MPRESYRRGGDTGSDSESRQRRRRREEQRTKHDSTHSASGLLHQQSNAERREYYRHTDYTTGQRGEEEEEERCRRRRERRRRRELERDQGDIEVDRKQRRRRQEERNLVAAEDEKQQRRQRRRERREQRALREERQHAQELSVEGLAQLNALNSERPTRRRRSRERVGEYLVQQEEPRRRRSGRVVSGQKVERGEAARSTVSQQSWWKLRLRGGGLSEKEYTEITEEELLLKKRRRKKTMAILGILLLILAVVISVAIVVSKKNAKPASKATSGASNGTPTNSNLNGLSPDSVPAAYKGTWMDPWSWYDTTDFNVTFTDVIVGGLPIIGLNSTWDDSAQANANVPALDESWEYGTIPIRGINVGGWFVLEPVLNPSFFNSFKSSQGVVDEWTLSETLGNGSAKSQIEPHYSSFITEQDFANMAAAGFDHVRIPFGYWAIVNYDDDPFVTQVAWRYLLRAIEWCRKYGLRVNLDLHGAPGSQNGWNHSGRQGEIRWLNGTDGDLNAQRTLEVHDQLSQFFAQPRYKNLIALYGLVNEPRMTFLDVDAVLNWTTTATELIQKNGVNATIVFGDGFMGLPNWQGKLQNVPNLLLDVHQYVIFNTGQLSLPHQQKTTFACGGWTAQTKQSMNKATGFGPTITGEWSQADTDCAPFLNNVGVGSRWQGTLNMVDTPGGSNNESVLEPACPTQNSPQCVCAPANADPSTYSAEYKAWLLQFALAQMDSFENGWGWFYWTWKTESAAQWSYSAGMAAGILPGKTWERSWNCSLPVPDYAAAGLAENY